MRALKLASRLLFRQGRLGALVFLLAGLAVATAALSAVGLFTDRVARALERQASETLAADLVITSRTPPASEWVEKARALGLETTTLVTLSSAIFINDTSQLIDIKGVTPGYPLRGQLGVRASVDGPEERIQAIPLLGQAWLEVRGLNELGLAIGDDLAIGRSNLRINQALSYEPDRSGSQFMLAPRLLMRLEDLQASGLLGPGARTRYRLLVAGNEWAVAEFAGWASDQLLTGQRLITPAEGEAQTAEALTQAKRFLGVAALSSVILAAVAILLAALRFAQSQRDTVALLKTFGAQSRTILSALTWMVFGLVAAGILIGGTIGFGFQAWIASVLADTSGTPLPQPRLWPMGMAAALTALLGAGFALPPLWGLKQVPPMRILNRSLDQKNLLSMGLWLIALASAVAVATLQLDDAQIAWVVLGGGLALALALAVLAWLAMHLSHLMAKRARASWRFGLAGLYRRKNGGIIQVTALGLGLMALLLLMVVRSELITQWQATLPAEAPNHFVVNVQPNQRDGVFTDLQQAGARHLQMGPMASVRLVSINGEPPPEERFSGQVNVSWLPEDIMDQVPTANTITQGQFFSKGARAEVSLANRWADRMGVGLGDELTFESGSRTFQAVVTSLREVEWNSFNINFFILLTPEAGESLPHQNIASFYWPDDRAPDQSLRPINEAYPNVSILNVGGLIERVLMIIERVSQAAEVVFILTLMAGLIVLLAALEATRDERRHESALMGALGASHAMIQRGLMIEYGIMALIAGLLASIGAVTIGRVLATEVFGFPYNPSLSVFVIGLVGAVILIVGSGWWGNRSVLRTPPMRILRSG